MVKKMNRAKVCSAAENAGSFCGDVRHPNYPERAQ